MAGNEIISKETAAASAPRKLAAILLFVLSLVLLALNIAYFLMRSWEDSFYMTSYATIYYPTDRPVIQEWQEVEGGIEPVLRWDAAVEGWKVLQDGKPYAENQGKLPFFPAPPDDTSEHTYTAIAQPEGLFPPMDFVIRFLPRSFHENRGLPRPDSYIIRTDEPAAKFKQFAVSDWVDDYEYMNQADLDEADATLRDKAGIRESDTVFEKLEKLMIHLRVELGKECRGTPSLDYRWKTPLQIYREMDSGEGKGWCTQHAQMFVFFANRAGLSTRLIQGARTQGNNFIFTGHTWVEAWIPEQGRWAWVEPSYGVVYARNKKGQVLNTVELANLRQHAAWDGVTARVYKDWGWPNLKGKEDTLVYANFAEVGRVVERQFITSSIYKWRRPPNVEDIRSDYDMLFKNWTFFWGNLERYFFKPPLAYANYPAEGTRIYWIRHLLLWSFVISAVATVVVCFRSRRRSA